MSSDAARPTWRTRITNQGPWDEENDPLDLAGAPGLPMPVKVSDIESLKPFFEHLASNVPFEPDGLQKEPHYGVDLIEFTKGVTYADGRLDLCKMVVGPQHIGELMHSLEGNDHIKHFLLGNNIIGPAGARSIANFVAKYPDRMETWYLAGNCINGEQFRTLVDAWVKSSVIHSIWLKRNALTPEAARDSFRLITEIKTLRTLDLDQTTLGDAGVSQLFELLAVHRSNEILPLKNLFLNANGIGEKACVSIANFLSKRHCALESLHLSCNPIGDKGALALAAGLTSNFSLCRLTMASCGLKSRGVIRVLESLSDHPHLQLLDLSMSYATEDLGQRFNWLEDEIADSVEHVLKRVSSLRYLSLGPTALSHATVERLSKSVPETQLLYYDLDSIHPSTNRKYRPTMKTTIRNTLERNVKAQYGEDMSYEKFLAGPIRFLRNTEDVRYIDSVYRNRDAAKARRGLMVLDKWWNENDDTLELVENS